MVINLTNINLDQWLVRFGFTHNERLPQELNDTQCFIKK